MPKNVTVFDTARPAKVRGARQRNGKNMYAGAYDRPTPEDIRLRADHGIVLPVAGGPSQNPNLGR